MVSFVDESTIHGVALIFGPNRNLFTRIFWSFLFVLSIIGVVYFINIAHTNWVIEPFLVLSNKNLRNLEEFPTFAVTVCPGIISENDTSIKNLRKRENEKDLVLSDEDCFYVQTNSLWCKDFEIFLSQRNNPTGDWALTG